MLGLAIQDFIKPKVNERRTYEKFTQSFTQKGVVFMNNDLQLNFTRRKAKFFEKIFRENV